MAVGGPARAGRRTDRPRQGPALALDRAGLLVARGGGDGADPGRVGFLFFFSSRRRHTRLVSDWSSDVCSSDLVHVHTSDEWRARTEELVDAWTIERRLALDPDRLFDKSAVPADSDVVTTTD